MNSYLNEIDEIRRRVNVSYEDAKEAIEKCNGDIVEALIYLENNNKINGMPGYTQKKGFWDKVGDLIHKGNIYRLVVRKREEIAVNISMNVALIIALVALPVIGLAAVGVLIALIMGYRFNIEGKPGEEIKVNESLDKFQSAFDNARNDGANNCSEEEKFNGDTQGTN